MDVEMTIRISRKTDVALKTGHLFSEDMLYRDTNNKTFTNPFFEALGSVVYYLLLYIFQVRMGRHFPTLKGTGEI